MRKLGGFILERCSSIILGLILAGCILYFAGPVVAENAKCPNGKICYWAEQKTNGKKTCRHNETGGWYFIRPLQRCGEQEVVKKSTNTPEPPIVTYTPKPPTPTAFQPEKKPTKSTDKTDRKVTSTPTAVRMIDGECITEDCICLLVTQAVIGNELDTDRNGLMDNLIHLMIQLLGD